MESIEIIGLIAGICTSASLIPLLVTTLKTKKEQDVSMLMFIVMLAGNALWIYYGLNRSQVSIILTNCLSLLLNIVLLILKFRYRHDK